MKPPISWGGTSLLHPGLQSPPPPGHSDSGPVGWQPRAGGYPFSPFPPPHPQGPHASLLPLCDGGFPSPGTPAATRVRGQGVRGDLSGRLATWTEPGQTRRSPTPASPASQLAAPVRPSVRQQRYPTRLSQAPARDRGPR